MRIYIIGNDGITLCREPPTALNDGKIAVAWHCQLKRPWYARRVGGAPARVGELLCSPIMLPAQAERGRKKVPLVR
jgi:hypothetical protein